MRLLGIIAVLFFLSFQGVTAQVAETAKEYNKLYQSRIKKEYLNDIYIPQDLKDAFTELRRLSDKKGLEKYKTATEETVVKKLYFSLGRWIMVNWGFHGGSRLSHYLKTKLGVSHPEDQAVFIMKSFHRSLNKKDLELKKTAKELTDKRFKKRKESADKIVKKGVRSRK